MRQAGRRIIGQADRHKGRQADGQTDRQTDRRQSDRQTDRQTDSQSDRQADAPDARRGEVEGFEVNAAGGVKRYQEEEDTIGQCFRKKGTPRKVAKMAV